MVKYTGKVPSEVPMATKSLRWCRSCLFFFFFLHCCRPARAKQVDRWVGVEGENWRSS